MSLSSRSLLTTMISLALYGPAIAYANPLNHEQFIAAHVDRSATPTCQAPVTESQKDINKLPIVIEANKAVGINNKAITYTGNVTVKQGPRTIIANEATYNQQTQQVTANGKVSINEGNVLVNSTSMTSNLKNKSSQMNNAKYRFLCEPGRGQASEILKYNADGTQFYKMKNGTYTTCPEDDKSWRFVASTLERKGNSPFANLYNARFEVHNVPVLYLPFLRVPVEKERLTGFLYPSIGLSSRDGFELTTPFYWNIAPNYDFTFMPKLMTNRGVQLNSQFRYLNAFGQGSFSEEYLPHDMKHPDDGSRWAYNWTHNGLYKQHWLFNVDYSRVSDIHYFDQLDSKIGNREDNNLMQTGSVSYQDTNWNATLLARNFQSLLAGTSSNYRILPQLTLNYYQPSLPYNLQWNSTAQFSRFENQNPVKPSADRFFGQTSLTLPYVTPWFSLTTQAKVNVTHYNQRFNRKAMLADADSQENKAQYIDGVNNLKHSVNRVVPTFRIHGSMNFERQTHFLGGNYTQTLEPQIQYLYVPKVEQSGIYNPVNIPGGGYDSSRLQQDYHGLFSDRQYSGLDYIAPANQFTIGATTRYYDSNYKERFNLSVGQIFYIDKKNSENEKVNYSATALNSEFNINDNWLAKGSIQYDTSEHNLQLANAALEYRNEQGVYIQPSYHYVSNNYLTEYAGTNPNLNPIINASTGARDGISQIGLSAGIPIYGGLSATGDYFFDTNTHKMIESQLGFTYRSSCWSISLGMNRYASTSLSAKDTQYENNFGFSFSLLGLKGAEPIGDNTGSNNVLGYSNAFTLNN
jgi:LPS-assembly protein